MNIMVFNVPAKIGGALTILNNFYQEVLENQSEEINWYFVISTPKLKSTKNIKILNFEWVKKSWGHRLYFDNFTAPRLVKDYNIDKVLSFQNMTINRVKVEQIVYVHQSLPFVKYKFSIRKNFKLWVYQNIIGNKIKKSIQKADKVIVQTEWMKESCAVKAQVDKKKITVIPPIPHVKVDNYFTPNEKSLKTFFYPAGASEYKNHEIIIEASKILKEKKLIDIEIIFTITGNENNYVKELKSFCEKYNLPIVFKGNLSKEEVYNMYTKSILVFPSYIETFGLPLLEAKLHKSIIFASNEVFSNEILKDYQNAYFFNTFNHKSLVKLMIDAYYNKIEYVIPFDEKSTKVNKQIIDYISS